MLEQDWSASLTRIYREVLAESGADGAERQDIVERAAARVELEITEGRLHYSIDGFIRSELRNVDESDGKKADQIMRTAAAGQGSFDLGDLDVVVTLGKGRRKLWRDVTEDDLTLMNSVRYENARGVQRAYAEWSDNFVALREVVSRYGTFGAAAEAGGFAPSPRARAA